MRTVAVKSQYQTIALASIQESTANPRRTFDESKLAGLAESLRIQGLIQPITVSQQRRLRDHRGCAALPCRPTCGVPRDARPRR
jgi:hypothetical protein